MKRTPDPLVEGILKGDRGALARAMTRVENGHPDGLEVLHRLFSRTGSAWRIGVTGPPGCGKSTLVNGLTHHLRAADHTVGIVAVDPTSPFTGGALLGDRVRMQTIAMDPGVFIRSMASRGELGGLSTTTQEIADLMDAFGKDYILLETVGVGQSEVEVADAADASMVVLSPESGDGIQAMKAGLMEIADIIVMNKADREGCDRSVTELEFMLRLQEPEEGSWRPPIVKTVATRNEGIDELVEAVMEYRRFLACEDRLALKRKKNTFKRIQNAALAHFQKRMWAGDDPRVEEAVLRVSQRKETHAEAAKRLFHALLEGDADAPGEEPNR
ncbi:MAG: methylmalonyl Co-A mutase-associated GTPase MeaB [Planctomycetota bacterium]|jgi:LAO/AO transport system kinase